MSQGTSKESGAVESSSSELDLKPSTQDRNDIESCSNCGLKEGTLQACSGCNKQGIKVLYCSTECQKEDWKKGHKKTCETVKLSQESNAKSNPTTTSSLLVEDELPTPLEYPFRRPTKLFTSSPSAALLRQIDYLESHPAVDYALFLPQDEILEVVFKEDRRHINSQLRNNAFSGNYFYNLDEHTRFTLMKDAHHARGFSEARQVQAVKNGVEGLLAWGIAVSNIATRKFGNNMASYAAVGDQVFREFGNLQLRAAKSMTPKMWDASIEMMASGIEAGWEEDKILRKKWGMEQSEK